MVTDLRLFQNCATIEITKFILRNKRNCCFDYSFVFSFVNGIITVFIPREYSARKLVLYELFILCISLEWIKSLIYLKTIVFLTAVGVVC